MGCGSSYNPRFVSIYKTYEQDFSLLGISENNLYKLYNIFSTLDSHESGWISITSLFQFLNIEETNFTRRIFSMYDDRCKGFIDFRDFVIIMWDYCTLTRKAMVHFIFELYDSDGSKDIDKEEALTMIKDMFGEAFLNDRNAVRTYKRVNEIKQTTKIDIDIFWEFVENNPTLLNPAFALQSLLQVAVVGSQYWETLTKRRVTSFGDKKYFSAKLIISRYSASKNIPKSKLPKHWKTDDDNNRILNASSLSGLGGSNKLKCTIGTYDMSEENIAALCQNDNTSNMGNELNTLLAFKITLSDRILTQQKIEENLSKNHRKTKSTQRSASDQKVHIEAPLTKSKSMKFNMKQIQASQREEDGSQTILKLHKQKSM